MLSSLSPLASSPTLTFLTLLTPPSLVLTRTHHSSRRTRLRYSLTGSGTMRVSWGYPISWWSITAQRNHVYVRSYRRWYP